MLVTRLLIALLCAALSTPLLAQGSPSVRAPTGKWVVDFNESQCIASRNYGTADKPLVLVLKHPPMGDMVQIGIVRSGSAGRYARQVEAKLRFDNLSPIDLGMILFRPKGKDQRVLLANLSLAQFAPIHSAKTLTVQSRGEIDHSFQIDQMDHLTRIMASCVADLRQVWNVGDGTELPQRLRQSASGSLAGIFTGDDYPNSAINESKSGSVRVVLLIDETGRVADCTAIETSGVAALDAQSCVLISQRARLKPAIGLDGKPAKSGHIQRITWRIEG